MSIQATFIGRLGRDPETRTVGNGNSVCNFTVAVDHGYGDKKSTTWVRVAAWGKRGEFVQRFFSKGKTVFVSGELYTREYEGKTYVELDASTVEFAGSKGDDATPSNGATSNATGAGGTYADDSIPF